MTPGNRFSLFAQPLDRAALVAYFLGAVIPLGALGFVTQKYLEVARLQPGAGVTLFQSRWFLLALIVSIAILSLASFLALRRSTRHSCMTWARKQCPSAISHKCSPTRSD